MPRRRPWPPAAPFVVFGVAAIIAAGLISAVLASMLSRAAVAFDSIDQSPGATPLAALPLGRVSTAGMAGRLPGAGGRHRPDRSRCRAGAAFDPTSVSGDGRRAEFAAFNLGNAGVVVGTIIAAPGLVDAGGGALVVALLLFLWTSRSRGTGGWLRYLYWLLVAILVVSIPVGLVLAHLRHG